jgi:hypothetical protein
VHGVFHIITSILLHVTPYNKVRVSLSRLVTNVNQELVRNVLLICFLALGVLTLRTLPLLRDALDESCCIHYIHSTILDILPLTGNPVNVNANVSPPLRTETSCLMHPPMQVTA